MLLFRRTIDMFASNVGPNLRRRVENPYSTAVRTHYCAGIAALAPAISWRPCTRQSVSPSVASVASVPASPASAPWPLTSPLTSPLTAPQFHASLPPSNKITNNPSFNKTFTSNSQVITLSNEKHTGNGLYLHVLFICDSATRLGQTDKCWMPSTVCRETQLLDCLPPSVTCSRMHPRWYPQRHQVI